MARRIIEAGYPVTLWARRPATLEPFADTAAKTAGTPAELAAASDLVCLCVRDDADIEEITAGRRRARRLAAGGVIAVHSTVHPDTCRRLAERAADAGRPLIDAPVSGGAPAAPRAGCWSWSAATTRRVEFCRPVFASYGDPVVHLGPLGAGQVTKLLNNAAVHRAPRDRREPAHPRRVARRRPAPAGRRDLARQRGQLRARAGGRRRAARLTASPGTPGRCCARTCG